MLYAILNNNQEVHETESDLLGIYNTKLKAENALRELVKDWKLSTDKIEELADFGEILFQIEEVPINSIVQSNNRWNYCLTKDGDVVQDKTFNPDGTLR